VGILRSLDALTSDRLVADSRDRSNSKNEQCDHTSLVEDLDHSSEIPTPSRFFHITGTVENCQGVSNVGEEGLGVAEFEDGYGSRGSCVQSRVCFIMENSM